MIDTCAVRRHCTWPAQRKRKYRAVGRSNFPREFGFTQARLYPCSRSSNSACSPRTHSSIAVLLLPTPRTATPATAQVVRVMTHEACHVAAGVLCCCSAACVPLILLLTSIHDLHVHGRPPWVEERVSQPNFRQCGDESEMTPRGPKRFLGLGRRPEAIHTFTGSGIISGHRVRDL